MIRRTFLRIMVALGIAPAGVLTTAARRAEGRIGWREISSRGDVLSWDDPGSTPLAELRAAVRAAYGRCEPIRAPMNVNLDDFEETVGFRPTTAVLGEKLTGEVLEGSVKIWIDKRPGRYGVDWEFEGPPSDGVMRFLR